MSSASTLGAHIRRAREARNLSANELSEKAGVNRLTLRDLETGAGNPRLSTLLAVCHVLELDLNVLPERLNTLVASDEDRKPGAMTRLLKSKRAAGSRNES